MGDLACHAHHGAREQGMDELKQMWQRNPARRWSTTKLATWASQLELVTDVEQAFHISR